MSRLVGSDRYYSQDCPSASGNGFYKVFRKKGHAGNLEYYFKKAENTTPLSREKEKRGSGMRGVSKIKKRIKAYQWNPMT
ncbi:hypothetical protein [Desulfobacter postgatei]|uniref:hypothetical protein n=1 Tax=Desulfobacter postgatei TaxID=2293 RepID=UPI00259B6DD1|nr:hypothetical protein [uncultured Desulfobacter sp.]